MRNLLSFFLMLVLTYATAGDSAKVLVSRPDPVIVVTTDSETGKVTQTIEIPSEASSCVEYNGGECKESDYFKATIVKTSEVDHE